MSIHKRYRICRRHFDSDCLNGGCRRLLNTAVPTLYLDSTSLENLSNVGNSGDEHPLYKSQSVIYLPEGADIDDHIELLIPETKPIIERKNVKRKQKFKSMTFEMEFSHQFSTFHSFECKFTIIEAKIRRVASVA